MNLHAALALAALVLLAPAAAACDGISPGDEVNAGAWFDEGGARCTLAFLVANRDGLYFATAGHCLQVDQGMLVPGQGEIGVGAFRHLVPDTGQPTDGAPGEDFGLIRIHPDFYGSLNPKICGWDGPTGIYDEAPGGGNVRHWGHGLVFAEGGELTQRRQGANLVNDESFAFYWTGAGLPGDSGSAVVHEDGRALGVLTHLRINPWTNGGTHLLRGFALAEAAGFAPLRLVLAGEDPLAVLAALRGNAPPPAGGTTPDNATAPPPDSGGNGTQPEPSGNASQPGDERPEPADDEGAPAPEDPLTSARAEDGGKRARIPGFAPLLVLLALLAASWRRA